MGRRRRHEQPEQVTKALSTSGLSGGNLCVEVTETVLVENLDAAARVLTDLRAMGVSISLDDFGTGHASIGYLSALPLDEVKIDRSFVQRIEHEHRAAALVSSIVTLARALDLGVVAEGIETTTQLQWLTRNACSRGQGFLFSVPGPA